MNGKSEFLKQIFNTEWSQLSIFFVCIFLKIVNLFTIPDAFSYIIPLNYNGWEERISETNTEH